jgi:predicted transcriptional regulator
MEIAISIRSEYLNKIRLGEKKWELRKKLPIDKINSGKINKVWVWETSPVSKIVGYMEISNLEQGTPQELWDKYGSEFGVDKKFYDYYYENNQYALALKINKWVENILCSNTDKSINVYAPQGYVYVKNN